MNDRKDILSLFFVAVRITHMNKFSFQVTSTYVGPTRTLTVPWFFRLFQDAAIEDAEKIGYGQTKTMSQGLLWVFSRVYVRFNAMPKYLSNATFETHPGGKKAFAFMRYATMYDDQEKVAAELSSVWALIHEDTRKVEMRPELDDIDQTTGDEISLPGRIEKRDASFLRSQEIRYSDIDLNGHMNNVRYLEMLMNLHDAEFYKKNQVKELLIQYESEIRFGEFVDLYVDESKTYVRGVVGDRIAFEANLKYGPLE